MIRSRWWAIALAVLVSAQTGAQERSAPPFFPVAVWYAGGTARAPMVSPIDSESPSRWRADLQQIKALGFNTVRTWVEWSHGEPRRGEYHLEQLDLLLKLAEDVGLKVIVQVYVDSAPEWVGRAHPDARFVAQSGDAIPSQAAPGFCIDQHAVRDIVHAFFAEVARHASRSPAFHAYDVWSEPAVMNWAQPAYIPNAQYCYCTHTQARFRTWLQRRYPSIEALNRAWYRTFSDWSEVEPPRFGTILTYADFTDWRLFIGEKIADDLRGRADAVRSVDRTHLVTSHAPNPSPVFRSLADAMDASDDYLMGASVDYFGTSFYPKLTSPDRDWPIERRALVMDAVKSVTGDRGFYVGELQSGAGVHGVIAGTPITGDDLATWAWGLLSRGAKAISFYAYYPMSTGYEAGGYGLIDLDGTPTPRARIAGETAKRIAANAALWADVKPDPAEVAIVFNPLTPLLGGEQAYGDRRGMHRAVAGYHRMFFERNIPVDLPSARDLSAARLARYKLVIVPYPVVMTAGMSDALSAYAEGGGHVFFEARPGWQDPHGSASSVLPGFGWHNRFGARETQLEPVKTATVTWDGTTFLGSGFVERLQMIAADTRVLATFPDGAPAVVERAVGRGRAALLATFAGEQNQQEPVAQHGLADRLIAWAGVTRSKDTSSGPVEIRRMVSTRTQVIVALNHGTTEASVRLALPAATESAAIRELTANDGDGLTRLVGALTATLAPRQVRVFRIDR